MAAKYVIVTGANTGIGKATALELAKRGMSVTLGPPPFLRVVFLADFAFDDVSALACRNIESGTKAAAELVSLTGNQSVRFMHCDLASLRSIRKFVDEYKRNEYPLHILINNAGVMACPLGYTQDGFEMHLGVNHLGHFLLTTSLLELLCSSAAQMRKSSRIVVLASDAEWFGHLDFEDLNYSERAYNPWLAYAQSKLANCLFNLELSRRSDMLQLPVICNAMHPGIVDTKLIRYIFPQVVDDTSSESKVRSILRKFIGLRSPRQGAETAIYLATSEKAESVSGKYFRDCRVAKPSSKALDEALARKLWDVSEELIGLQPSTSI